MSARDDGGPAFPAPHLGEMQFGDPTAYSGMSLRDHFAGEAMSALVAGSTCNEAHGAADLIATIAYTMADAMIRARGAE